MTSFFHVTHFQEYGKMYSLWVQGRGQAKASKRISHHRKIYIPDDDQKWKSYVESFIRQPTASIPGTVLSQGTRPQPCDLLEKRSTETMQQMETGRDGSFITVINACSQNHRNLFIFKFSTSYLTQLRPELITQGINKEMYCFPETLKEIWITFLH